MDISICFTPEFTEAAKNFYLSLLGVSATLFILRWLADVDAQDYSHDFDQYE
jgi:hypothetical protein